MFCMGVTCGQIAQAVEPVGVLMPMLGAAVGILLAVGALTVAGLIREEARDRDH